MIPLLSQRLWRGPWLSCEDNPNSFLAFLERKPLHVYGTEKDKYIGTIWEYYIGDKCL